MKEDIKNNFNSEEKILQYIKSEDKKTRIIGLFLRAKGTTLENKEQLNRIYARHLRKAQELDCYSDERIMRTMKHLIDNAEYKWTLESVLKSIDEDFDKLEGKEPIIILKDGERIYSVERIKQLERDGKIYYNGSRWGENDEDNDRGS